MGKHFDALVDLVKTNIPQTHDSRSRIDVGGYLGDMVHYCHLFHFPVTRGEIIPSSGNNTPTFHDYLSAFIRSSREHGKFLCTPFPHTAIEDPEGFRFLDLINGNAYVLTSFSSEQTARGPRSSLQIGRVELTPLPEFRTAMHVNTGMYYSASIFRGELTELNFSHLGPGPMLALADKTARAAVTFVEELALIMDLGYFIIKQESHASLAEDRKIASHPVRERKPRKTALRPRYVSLNQEDAVNLIARESEESRPLHLVEGYRKVLTSPRFREARGKILEIPQHNRGKSVFEGRNGTRYTVYVKESLDRLTIPRE